MESFEKRAKKAKALILPILEKYKVDIGSKHFLKTNITELPTNLMGFIESEVAWLDVSANQKK